MFNRYSIRPKWQTIIISLFLFCFPFMAAWLFLKIGFICYKYNNETLQSFFTAMVFLIVPIGLISNLLLLTYLSSFFYSVYRYKKVLIASIIISLLIFVPMCILQTLIYFMGLGLLFPKV